MTARFVDVIAEHRRNRQLAAMACRHHDSQLGGLQLDDAIEGGETEVIEPNMPETLDDVSESLRARARRLEVEAATAVSIDKQGYQRLRYHGRVVRGVPPRRHLDDQDLAFAIDELQRARVELAVAYDIDAPPIQKRGAIRRALDRVRYGTGFVLDLLERHEALE